jgi:lipoyl(octanoyl) transferase
MLEAVVIDALSRFGIVGERVPGRPGVWAGGAKIASIGVRAQGGVTTHGFALNVSTDLSWFDAIVPCGLADARMTSMAELLDAAPAIEDVEDAVTEAFARIFQVPIVEPGPGLEAADAPPWLEPSASRGS